MPLPWMDEALSDDVAEEARATLIDLIKHYAEVSGVDLSPMIDPKTGKPRKTVSTKETGKVELFTFVALKLSEMVEKSPPWGWRYVTNMWSDEYQQKPSRLMAQAVEKLAAHIDGLPVQVAKTAPVQVYAFPGMVRPGSIVYGQSVRCGVCGVWFVPDNPFRKKCKTCSPPRVRKNGGAH